MKIHVPMHVTPDFFGHEVSRLAQARREGRSTRTTYIKPTKISIRERIALANKLENL